MGFVLAKTAGVDATVGCAPDLVVPDGYATQFRTDPVSKGMWSTDGQWSDAAPSALSQTGAVTFTVATYSRLTRVGRKVTWQGSLTVTGTGTGGSVVHLDTPLAYPFAPLGYAAAVRSIGTAVLFDASANVYYRALAVPVALNQLSFLYTGSNAANYLGATDFTAALAVGDILSWDATWETP